MLENHYLNSLYPLQDSVLNLLGKVSGAFYLTGGTALGRFYLNHRFSDDLDFFLNRALDFQSQTELAIEELKRNFPVDLRVSSES
jgi:predicted nucleotidyltransferase component of viral defense system